MTPEQDWQPSASLAVLQLRANLLATTRDFFHQRDVLEVDTPILSHAATPDPTLASFATTEMVVPHPERSRYLHTSPEFAMKRLLAAGSGPIYQLCKVFRQGEAGRQHNPEFTLLEWYRPGWDHHTLMEEVDAFVRYALDTHLSLGATLKLSYREALQQYAGVDPLEASPSDLKAAAEQHNITAVMGSAGDDRDTWLDLLMSHVVQANLPQGRPIFIYDYPASQAALARIRPGTPPVAARFELFINGLELANGFHELTDAKEQRQRFEKELKRRRQAGLPEVPLDERFLAALSHGLPESAGVALGFDRLVMLAAGVEDIAQVLAFSHDQA